MKSYKFIFKALVLCFILSSVSCSDEFINKPIQPGTESDISFRRTADGLLYTLNTCYATLRGSWWLPYPEYKMHLGNYRGDDSQVGGQGLGANQTELAVSNYNIFPTSETFYQFWRLCYVGIHYANAVIDCAPTALTNASLTDVPRINNYVGEAKVMRAYFYFELVKDFGDVPLLLSSTDQTFLPRANRLLVYDQIQKDLIEASAVLLPANQLAAANKGRMSSGAALALLAKVYLFRASIETDKANEYYTLAHQTAQTVIASAQFTLLPTYDAIWKQSGDFSSEGIIEAGFPAADQKGDVRYFGINLAPRYYYTSKIGGLNVKGPASPYGWGFNTPTQDFVNAFEAGDPRKNWTVLEQGDSANCGVVNKSTMQLICFDHSLTGYYGRKYLPDGYPYNGQSHLNIKFFRYADLLLIGAEAANEIGQTTDALAWLEMVRGRARNTGAAPHHEADKVVGVPSVVVETDKDALRLILQHERRVELGQEDGRFYDLVRWDGKNGFDMKSRIETAQALVGPNFQIDNDLLSGTSRPSHVVVFEPKHKLGPIPQSEIKVSGNTLSQNQGY